LAKRAVVVVGRKKPMRYVTACITLFNRGEDEVILRARGRNMENCIKTIMLLRKGFYSDLKVKEINIGSDMISSGDRVRYVSYLEVVLKR